jgi:hypothetical protein
MIFYEQTLQLVQKHGMNTQHIKLANQIFLFSLS